MGTIVSKKVTRVNKSRISECYAQSSDNQQPYTVHLVNVSSECLSMHSGLRITFDTEHPSPVGAERKNS